MQPAVAGDEANQLRKGFAGQSVRQVVRGGGAEVRIRLPNVYGTRPLRVAGTTVGRSAGGALNWPETIKAVTFGHAAKAVIPPLSTGSRCPGRSARRLVGVVNAGIGTGKLLHDSACGGEEGMSRFARDVLDRPGVRSVVVHLGANDIGAPEVDDPCVRPNPKVTARQLIDGHRELIRVAHARGVKAVGMTIPPMKGALFPM